MLQLRPRACHYKKGFASREQHAAVKRYAQLVNAHITDAELRGGPGTISHWVCSLALLALLVQKYKY